ncbi:hypothetical protein MTP04_16470 [Lysinibacillus sp. PLM2]|nr:hypothetical protein MTP04_16470 [Lysinibacillus sp. PLM2]
MEEYPSPNSYHQTSPHSVIIKFNSEIDENFSLVILDINNQVITSNENTKAATLNETQKEIHMKLPLLESGKYMVKYYVISLNDGHPVEGTYYFEVSTIQKGKQGNIINNPLNNEIHFNYLDFFINTMNFIYTLGLTLTIGWVLWWRKIQSFSPELIRKYRFLGFEFQMLHMVGLISIILIKLNIFSNNGVTFTTNFIFETNFGFLWFVSLLVSFIGFIFLFKNPIFDYSWILILILCRVLNGHSMEYAPIYITNLSNIAHILAAAIWISGITFIIIFWRKERLYVREFLSVFSNYAFYSIILLVITGSLLTIFYLPSLNLFHSAWSILIFIKLLLVIIILIIGLKINRMKQKELSVLSLGKWIKLDFLFMILIMIIVSLLTNINPNG